MTMLASQITSLTVVYSIVYSGVNQRKHQSSASLAFVREIHRGPVNFPHKWPVTRKMFPFDDVIMGLNVSTETILCWIIPVPVQFVWHKVIQVICQKLIPGLDVIAYYTENFFLQIWKYLIKMYTFSCILLIFMFLSAHAKIRMFWGVTLPRNISEAYQVCNKKVQPFNWTEEK